MRVLVTYGWCRTACIACESLAAAGFAVSACGPSPLSMSRFSRRVRTFDVVPDSFRDGEGYVKALARIVRDRDIRVLLPVHEDALEIRRFAHVLPGDLIVACPSYAALRTGLDKYRIIDAASRAGVTVPETFAPGSVAEARTRIRHWRPPLLIKTRRGNGGKGVFRAKTTEQAIQEYERLVAAFELRDENLPVLQQFVQGEVVGSCFLAQRGKVLACFVERYLRCKENGFGTSVLREAACDDRIVEDTRRLCAALDWNGIGHLDFIRPSGDSRPYLIEMNPRLWGALNLAVANGYNFPLAAVQLALGGLEPEVAFKPSVKAKSSLWIAGELMACAAELRKGKWFAPFRSLTRILFPGRSCSYDDWRLRDPLPLLAELAYYATCFHSSGGETNPWTESMFKF